MKVPFIPVMIGLCLLQTAASTQPASADYLRHFGHEENRSFRQQGKASIDLAEGHFGRAAHHEDRAFRDQGRAAFGRHHY